MNSHKVETGAGITAGMVPGAIEISPRVIPHLEEVKRQSILAHEWPIGDAWMVTNGELIAILGAVASLFFVCRAILRKDK